MDLVSTAPVEALAWAIHLSVAPVFLLAGISGLSNVLTNRVNGRIDRARRLQAGASQSSNWDCLLELQIQKNSTMACLMVAVVLFLGEAQLATGQLRRHFKVPLQGSSNYFLLQ